MKVTENRLGKQLSGTFQVLAYNTNVNVLIDEKHNMRKNKEILIYGDKQVDF
jgi:hypothetical protein